jgi:copper(I)-binding protein
VRVAPERPGDVRELEFAAVLAGVALFLVLLAVVGIGVSAIRNSPGGWASSGGRHASGAPAPTPTPAGPAIEVTDAWTTPGSSIAAVYLRITNHGRADRLTRVTAEDAGSVLLMGANGEVSHASTRGAVAVDMEVPRGVTELAPGGRHLMLGELATTLGPGAVLPLELTFKRAGPIDTQVQVVTPEEAVARSR